jgi:hypothetical protein
MKFYWNYLVAFALTAAILSCETSGKNERDLAVAAAQTVSASVEKAGNGDVSPANNPAFAANTRNAAQMVAAGFKRYGIEKGIVTYRLDGAMKGIEVIYFDSWGWREAHYERTESEVGSFHEKINRVQYLDGERRYQYDPKTQVATYFDSPQVQEAADKWGTKDMAKVGLEMLKSMGGRPEGTGIVGDIECEIWKIDRMKTTLWMWQGLTLGEKAFAMDIPVSRRALTVKTDVEIPLDKLLLPESGVEVKMGR